MSISMSKSVNISISIRISIRKSMSIRMSIGISISTSCGYTVAPSPSLYLGGHFQGWVWAGVESGSLPEDKCKHTYKYTV